MAQSIRRTQFIEWARDNGHGSFSHATLSRAMERQYTGRELTARQQGIAAIAEAYRSTITEADSIAA